MSVDSMLYVHESDRVALQGLKAIPGFSALLKAYMKVWSEQCCRVLNMSTNLKVSEDQLPEYYHMLPPICEKLGIEIPELYIELNVVPNAYTSGDTKPFIVMTSGLIETLPKELIPSVLAHECGHIACHHVLYTTMGTMILNGATSFLGLGGLVTLPIQIAFYYWMRSSELSADRAAAICDGNAEKVIETCMRFAGFDKDIDEKANIEAFMAQAMEYRQMVKDSKWNKTIEFLMFSERTHPLNAVRAYECSEWAKTEQFKNIIEYLDGGHLRIREKASKLPVPKPSSYCVGKTVGEIMLMFENVGFSEIELERVFEAEKSAKFGQVLSVSIDGQDKFNAGAWFPSEAQIKIAYFEPYSEDELSDMHLGEIRVPNSAKHYIGQDRYHVYGELAEAGFTNITTQEMQNAKKGWLTKNGSVAAVVIDGQEQFEKGDWFKPDAPVSIGYYPNSDSKKD